MAQDSGRSQNQRRCLYIESSPRKARSASTTAAGVFLAELSGLYPEVLIDRLDLWNADLPDFTGAAIEAKYAKLAGLPQSDAQQAAWQQIGQFVAQLKSADAIVVSTPMWNFGIPYKLKHWIDLITQPGLTFTFDPVAGYSPLLDTKPTLVILSSAGDYTNGPSRGRPDLATPYLNAALKFIGLGDISFVPVGPTVGTTKEVATGRVTAERSLLALAGSFMGAAR
ncbi:MAG: NAD(P)H-dependent oxidoreductase [Pseudolabrys sp.]|nr:NAD(P)H-dependent oxidoreductase [Pseudolabrys sp.]